MSNNEHGQSLIEVLVVGVVSAMMVVALIAIILSSLKNAQFAQNQTQATKLAQDTIDKIRILRDNNAYNTLGSSCFIELFNVGSGAPFVCGTNKFCYYKLSGSSSMTFSGADIYPPTNSSLGVDYLTGGFSRQIRVSQDVSGAYVRLIVTISWQDSSGSHSSNLETIITKPNYDCVPAT